MFVPWFVLDLSLTRSLTRRATIGPRSRSACTARDVGE